MKFNNSELELFELLKRPQEMAELCCASTEMIALTVDQASVLCNALQGIISGEFDSDSMLEIHKQFLVFCIEQHSGKKTPMFETVKDKVERIALKSFDAPDPGEIYLNKPFGKRVEFFGGDVQAFKEARKKYVDEHDLIAKFALQDFEQNYVKNGVCTFQRTTIHRNIKNLKALTWAEKTFIYETVFDFQMTMNGVVDHGKVYGQGAIESRIEKLCFFDDIQVCGYKLPNVALALAFDKAIKPFVMKRELKSFLFPSLLQKQFKNAVKQVSKPGVFHWVIERNSSVKAEVKHFEKSGVWFLSVHSPSGFFWAQTNRRLHTKALLAGELKRLGW